MAAAIPDPSWGPVLVGSRAWVGISVAPGPLFTVVCSTASRDFCIAFVSLKVLPPEHYFQEQRTVLSLSKLCFTDSDLSLVMIVSERGLHSSLFLWSRPVLELEFNPNWSGQALTTSAISVPSPHPSPSLITYLSNTDLLSKNTLPPSWVFFLRLSSARATCIS